VALPAHVLGCVIKNSAKILACVQVVCIFDLLLAIPSVLTNQYYCQPLTFVPVHISYSFLNVHVFCGFCHLVQYSDFVMICQEKSCLSCSTLQVAHTCTVYNFLISCTKFLFVIDQGFSTCGTQRSSRSYACNFHFFTKT